MRIVYLVCALAFVMLGCDQGITFDEYGRVQGTGQQVRRYKSGAKKLVEDYVDGKPIRSRWYKPDGTFIQETLWTPDKSGEAVYLREDGSILRRMRYIKGRPEGESVEYDELGNVTAIRQFRAGKPVRAATTQAAGEPSPSDAPELAP